VEIVADDGAGFVRGLHCFGNDLAGTLGERSVNAAGVEPADTLLNEELLPIDFAGLHAGGGGVAAIVQGDGAALGMTDFGEVEADAVDLADAIVLLGDSVADVHADGAGVVG